MFKKILYTPFFSCLAVLFVFLFVANNVWDGIDTHINGDGRGYYEYLPATFIYRDLELNYLDTLESEHYDTRVMRDDYYLKVDGVRHNKYFIGTALMQLPSFLLAHGYVKLSGKYKADGFSQPYQNFSYYNTLLFFFLGLLCVFGILKSYQIKFPLILLVISGLCFATSLPFYVFVDSSYSHVYSFTLIAFFIFSIRKYLQTQAKRFIYFSIIAFCLILLIRPVNGLLILFLPLIFGSLSATLETFKSLLRERKKEILIAVLIGFGMLFLQCLVWYFSSGHWISYSYGNEGFIWSHQYFIDFLFSVKKGFFFWAPWFFCCFVFAVLACIFLKEYRVLLLFFVPFYILVFVSSSWWCWTYGGSLGSRPLVDFYPVFILLFIPFLQWKPKVSAVFLSLNLLVFAPLICTEILQYQRYIIKQDNMNWKEYKTVFLQTDPTWTAFLYRRDYLGKTRPTKLISKKLSYEPFKVIEVDKTQIVRKKNIISIAEYSFTSKDVYLGNWLDLYVKDSLDSIRTRLTIQFKNCLKHPSIKNSFTVRQELPWDLNEFTISLEINNLDKKTTFENIKLNVYEVKEAK